MADPHVQDTLFELTGVGVVQTDLKTGRFVRANRTFCAMVGYSEAELRGMTYLELTHPDDRARDAASFAALRQGGDGRSLTRCVCKDGRVVWLELHVTVLGEGDEAVNLTVVNDVTGRRRTDEALRESEEKYRTLFESIDEGFCTVEVSFDESEKAVDYRFLQVNPAFERQTGIENAVGRWMREVAPEHEAHWFELYGRVALTGEPVRSVHEAAQLGRWYDVYAFRVEDPELRRVGVLFNDMTERKRAAADLERRAEFDAFRVKLNDALHPLDDPLEVQRAAMRVVGEHLQIDRVQYGELTDDEQTLIVADSYTRGDFPKLKGNFPASSFGAAAETLRRGQTLVVENVNTEPGYSEAELAAFAAINLVSVVGVPLVKAGRWVTNLGAHHGSPRRWTEDEIAMLQETAERTWAAVERARAEEDLRENRERLRFALEAASLGAWDLDLTTGQATRTLRHDSCFGATEPFSDWSYEKFLSFVHPEDRAEVGRSFGEALKGTKEWHFECRVVWADGSVHWIEARGSVYRTVDGKPARMLGIVSDITERKRAEEALRDSEEKFRTFVSATSDVVYKMSADWREMHSLIGKEFIATTEDPREDWTDEYIPEADKQAVWEAINRAIQTRSVFELEHRVVRLGGSVGWTFSRAVPVFGERGEILEWLGAARDISERKRAEAALRESEEKFRTLFETIDEGFGIFEVFSDERGRVTDFIYREANRAFERHSEMRDFLGKRASEVLPNLEQEVLDLLTGVYQTGEPVRAEQFVADLGRWFTFQYSLVGEAGSPLIAAVFNDITERKWRERQQEFLLKLSDALRAETNADDVANRALQMLFEQMRLDRCYIGVYRLEEDRADLTHQVGNNRVPPLPDVIRLSDFPEALRVTFDRTLVIEDFAETEGLSDADRRNIAALGLRALVAASLRKGENNPLWTIVAVSASPRRWTRGEVALIEEVTERTWAAMERARAEEALHESEERYRTLFSSMDEAYAVVEVLADERGEWNDFLFLEVNPAFEKHTGMVNAVGRQATEILGAPNPRWAEVYGRVAETGEPVRFEADEPTLSRVFDLYAFRLGGAGSRRVAVLFTDITERKRAEDALRASEERLRLTVESVKDYAIFTLDPERRITSWNSGAVRMFGYSEAEAIGEGGDIIFTPEDREAGVPAEEARQAREEGRADDNRWHLRRDGSRFFVSGVVAPLYEGRRLTGYVKVARDLTEQRRQEGERERLLAELARLNETLEGRVEERTEALRHSERRFSQAFYVNPIPACMTTLGRETFVEVNDAFLSLTGYERDEVVGRTSRELGMWSSSEDQKKLGEVQQGGKDFRNLELGMRTKAGEVKNILISAAVIRLDGSEGYLKMFYDITERKQTEARLMGAIQEVMGDAAWFSQRVIEKMANVRLSEHPVQVSEFSKREREVLERLAKGASNEAIAADLSIAIQTVRNYISTIYDKLGVHSRAEAIVWARERGIV